MENATKERSVTYVGVITFCNMDGVDIGSLESYQNSYGVITKVAVHKGRYECYYDLIEDLKHVNAIMIVSSDYQGEVLKTPEKLGDINVGLSGVVGFFSSPKKEYTGKQLEKYMGELISQHNGKAWVHLNSKQFMAPSSQGIATRVPVFVHRDADGNVDAFQMEFNRKADEEMAEAIETA